MKISRIISSKKVQKITFWLLLIAVLAIALGLRIYRLDAASFWLDELHSAQRAASLTLIELYKYRYMPLYYAMLHILSFFGSPPLQLFYRSWSVLLGVLSVYWLYCMGRKLISKELGIAAALFLAVAPFHIFYSQEVRYYSQMVFLFLVMCVFGITWSKTMSWKSLLLTAFFAAAMLMTQIYSIIMLPGFALFLIYCLVRNLIITKKRKKHVFVKIIAQILVAGILFLLLSSSVLKLRMFGTTNTTGESEFVRQGIVSVSHIKPMISPANISNKIQTWFFRSPTEYKWYYYLFLIGIIGGLFFSKSRKTAIFTSLMIYTAFYVQSYAPKTQFFARYVITILPIFLLGAALGISVIVNFFFYLIGFFHQKNRNIIKSTYLIQYSSILLLMVVMLYLFDFSKIAWAYKRPGFGRKYLDWREAGGFVRSNSLNRIALCAYPHNYRKCLFMWLLGVGKNEMEYSDNMNLFARRGLSEIKPKPISLWVENNQSFGSGYNSTTIFSGRKGPLYLVGLTVPCSNYMQAFEMIAPAEPYFKNKCDKIYQKFKKLPKKLNFDAGSQECQPYLARGWSHNENQGSISYCWSDDETESSIFVPEIQSEKIDLKVSCRSYQPQLIEVWGNYTYLTNWNATEDWHQQIWRSLPNVFTNKINFLSFVFHKPLKYIHENIQRDSRALGIALDSVNIIRSETRLLPKNGEIEVGKNESAFLGKEWSHTEVWTEKPFRWIEGKNAELLVELPDNNNFKYLRWRCMPFHPSGSTQLEMKIKINDQEIFKSLLKDGWNIYEAKLPVVEGSIIIQIESSDSYQPCKYNIGNDTRSLSIAFDYLKIN